MLSQMVTTNQFNAFCIDCQKNRVTHANVTFGVYICGDCAQFIGENFQMMDGYTKTLFAEVWDPYQLSVMSLGGNQKFYEFMANYDKEKKAIMEKYSSKAAKWYAKKLAYEAKGVEFKDLPPAKNTAEEVERAKVKGKE